MHISNPSTTMVQRHQYLHNLLCPPQAQMSELDDFKAKIRLAMDNISDHLFTIETFLVADSGEHMNREKQEAIKSLKCLQTHIDDSEWDGLASNFHYFKQSLHEMHAGDCTGLPSSCLRCYAESLYGLPSSVTWDKSTGYAYFHEYMNLDKILNSGT